MYQWHDPVGAAGQTAGTFVFLMFLHYNSIQCEVIISPPFPVTTHFYGDGRRAFILVASMERSGWPWANSKYVCIAVLDCIRVKTGRSSKCEVIISHSCFLSKYTSMAMVGVHLSWSVESMERYRWAWTNRKYVCVVVPDFKVYSGSIQCEVIISPSCSNTIILQWRWSVRVHLGCMNGTISLALDEQAVRLYSCT